MTTMLNERSAVDAGRAPGFAFLRPWPLNLHQVFAVAPFYRGAWVDLVSDKSVTSSLEPSVPEEGELRLGLRLPGVPIRSRYRLIVLRDLRREMIFSTVPRTFSG